MADSNDKPAQRKRERRTAGDDNTVSKPSVPANNAEASTGSKGKKAATNATVPGAGANATSGNNNGQGSADPTDQSTKFPNLAFVDQVKNAIPEISKVIAKALAENTNKDEESEEDPRLAVDMVIRNSLSQFLEERTPSNELPQAPAFDPTKEINKNNWPKPGVDFKIPDSLDSMSVACLASYKNNIFYEACLKKAEANVRARPKDKSSWKSNDWGKLGSWWQDHETYLAALRSPIRQRVSLGGIEITKKKSGRAFEESYSSLRGSVKAYLGWMKSTKSTKSKPKKKWIPGYMELINKSQPEEPQYRIGKFVGRQKIKAAENKEAKKAKSAAARKAQAEAKREVAALQKDAKKIIEDKNGRRNNSNAAKKDETEEAVAADAGSPMDTDEGGMDVTGEDESGEEASEEGSGGEENEEESDGEENEDESGGEESEEEGSEYDEDRMEED